ncbi:MAG: hypothetical protein HY241_05250 [Actinobacteria bacterium]|nr:hypothetical protein [Actinomycetota bacterium]
MVTLEALLACDPERYTGLARLLRRFAEQLGRIEDGLTGPAGVTARPDWRGAAHELASHRAGDLATATRDAAQRAQAASEVLARFGHEIAVLKERARRLADQPAALEAEASELDRRAAGRLVEVSSLPDRRVGRRSSGARSSGARSSATPVVAGRVEPAAAAFRSVPRPSGTAGWDGPSVHADGSEQTKAFAATKPTAPTEHGTGHVGFTTTAAATAAASTARAAEPLAPAGTRTHHPTHATLGQMPGATPADGVPATPPGGSAGAGEGNPASVVGGLPGLAATAAAGAVGTATLVIAPSRPVGPVGPVGPQPVAVGPGASGGGEPHRSEEGRSASPAQGTFLIPPVTEAAPDRATVAPDRVDADDLRARYGGLNGVEPAPAGNAAEQAAGWSDHDDYPGVDDWQLITLPAGALITATGRLYPEGRETDGGGTGYAMPLDPADPVDPTDPVAVPMDDAARTGHEGRQVAPHRSPDGGWRYPAVQSTYRLVEPVEVAVCRPAANPQWGAGGMRQYFVPAFRTLVRTGAVTYLSSRTLDGGVSRIDADQVRERLRAVATR